MQRRLVLATDVSGLHIRPIIMGQAAQGKLLNCLTLENEAEMVPQNVSNKLPKCAGFQVPAVV